MPRPSLVPKLFAWECSTRSSPFDHKYLHKFLYHKYKGLQAGLAPSPIGEGCGGESKNNHLYSPHPNLLPQGKRCNYLCRYLCPSTRAQGKPSTKAQGMSFSKPVSKSLREGSLEERMGNSVLLQFFTSKARMAL